jgi:hypothetical protein
MFFRKKINGGKLIIVKFDLVLKNFVLGERTKTGQKFELNGKKNIYNNHL